MRITSSARTTTPAKSIVKMTLTMVTVKMIMTMTPDSHKDNNFHEDDKPWTSTKMIVKMTPATAMVKTIATTMAPMTMTPDSHEDDNFHKDNCKYDTHNGDSEDYHDYDP